jgi:peroxiredoxin
MQRSIASLALLWIIAAPAWAGTYNPDRNVGDVVPAWTDLPGADGRTHSWSDVADRDAVVVVFTCNSCPYAVDYEGRLKDFATRHAGPQSRVAVVAINSNRIPADALPAMKVRAEEKGFRFPYVFDESQSVARSFGAVRTPEWFVLDRQRRIVFMGAMDDSPKPADVRRRYVDDAVAAVLAGKTPEVVETPPVGCQIRFDRRRSR